MEDTHYTLPLKRGRYKIVVKPRMTHAQFKLALETGKPLIKYQCGRMILPLIIQSVSAETEPGTFEVVGLQDHVYYTARYVRGVVQSVDPTPAASSGYPATA